MLINLQVTFSSKIETKHPWHKIFWLGKENENLILRRRNTLKKFNPNTGKTRKILSQFVKDCITVSHSKNGNYIIGLQTDGKLFKWYKDTEVIHYICGDDVNLRRLCNFKQENGALRKINLYGNEWGHKVAIICYCDTNLFIYLCKSNNEELLCRASSSQFPEVETWMKIEDVNNSFPVLPSNCASLCWDFIFSSVQQNFSAAEFGLGAFVYSLQKSFKIYVLQVHFEKLRDRLGFLPTYFWKSVTLPFEKLESTIESIEDSPKMFVMRWSHSGNMLAISINLKHSAARNYIIFASKCLGKISISSLPEEFCQRRRYHSVCDMAWTNNDLFVVVINRLGSICLISRFGEPLTIATYGYSMDLAPAKFLNIHPLIFVKKIQGSFESDDTSRVSSESVEILHQRFSVSAHPRSPYIICSDGYMVTCLRLPKETVNAYSFVKIYLKHVRKLRKAFRKTLSVCEIEDERNDSLELTNVGSAKFRKSNLKSFSLTEFSPANSDDESSQVDPRVLRSSLIGNFESGTILWGSHSYKKPDENSNKIAPDDSKIISRSLMSIWGIISSLNSEWTSEWETFCLNAADQFFKFVLHLLKTSPTFKQFEEIILLIKNWLSICYGGNSQRSLLVPVHRSFKQIFLSILKYPVGESFAAFYENCAYLLQFTENLVSAFYFDDFSSHDNAACSRLPSLWRVLFQRTKLCNIDNVSLIKRFMEERKIPVKRHRQLVKSNGKMVSGCRVLLMAPKKWQTITNTWKADVESLFHCEISSKTTTKLSHLLHAVLYSLILNYQPKEITKYIFWLFDKINRNRAHLLVVKKTIASFTSILSHFVLGENFSIFPYYLPHSHRKKSKENRRLINISNKKLKEEINKYPAVVKHWTPDVAIALSLFVNDFQNASRLAYRFGDWKMSILIKYAQHLNSKHEKCIEHIGDILNDSIINECNTLTEIDHIFCKELFTAGVLCGFNIFYSITSNLLASLKNIIFIRDFSVIVPEYIHLSRPPFYCPQLTESSDVETAVSLEEKWAADVSIAVRKLANIFRTGNCLLSSAFSYLKYLRDKIGEVMKMKNVSNYLWTLEMIFKRLNLVANISNNDELASSSFRDFCSLCFFLHSRDKLNVALRNIRSENEDLSYRNRTKSTDKACLDALTWICHLSPFGNEAGWELDLLHVMISTVLEAPTDRRISHLVARLIPDPSTVPRAIKQRLELIFERWDQVNIRVASNRRHVNRLNNSSLSNIFTNQCQEVKDSVSKFESLIGPFEEKICFGSSTEWKLRPFEIEEDFFQFLKIFLEIILKQDLVSIEEEDADFILDAPYTVKFRQALFENLCILQTPISTLLESQLNVFSQRLAGDLTELSKCDCCSSQLQTCNNCASNWKQTLYKLKSNRSCLQYVSDLEISDFKLNKYEEKEERNILAWLVKWSKRDKRILPFVNHDQINGQIDCSLTFKQIWKSVTNNPISSDEKIEKEIVNEEDTLHVEETTEKSLSGRSDDLQTSMFEATLSENEIEKSEICIPNDVNGRINSPESIGIDLNSLNLEPDVTSNFFPSTKSWIWTNDFGLNEDLLNRESDEETIGSITSEWTLDADDTGELAAESLDIDLSGDKNGTQFSEIIIASPIEADPDNDTFDDVSTSKELGRNDSCDSRRIPSPQIEIASSPILISRSKKSIPPLLKFDESIKFRFNENSLKNRRFLSKDDLEQLTSKWINQCSDNLQENLPRKPEKLIILELPREPPTTFQLPQQQPVVNLQLLKELPEPVATSELPKQQPALINLRNESQILKTSTKAIQTQRILAKDSASNTSKGFAPSTRRNRKRNMTIEVLSSIDIKPNVENGSFNSSEIVRDKISLATQTSKTDVQLTSNPSLGENVNASELNLSKFPADFQNMESYQISHEAKAVISNSKVDITPLSCNETIDEINDEEYLNSSVSIFPSTTDILQFKTRLKQLEDEGFLELSNSTEVFKESLNQKSAINKNNLADQVFDSDYQSASGWESVKLRKNRNVSEKLRNSDVKFTVTSMDRISKRSEEKRLKLRSKHFEKRKDDALKFIDDVLVNPHLPNNNNYKKNIAYFETPKVTEYGNQNLQKSVRFDNEENSFVSTSDDNTLSSWVVPEEVKKILYGNTKRLPTDDEAYIKNCADISDLFSDGSSDDDSLFKNVE